MRAHAQRKEGVSWSGQQKMSKRFHPSSPSHLVPQSLLTTASGAKVLPLLILPLLPLSGIPEAVLRPDPSNSDTTSTTPATRGREGGREDCTPTTCIIINTAKMYYWMGPIFVLRSLIRRLLEHLYLCKTEQCSPISTVRGQSIILRGAHTFDVCLAWMRWRPSS